MRLCKLNQVTADKIISFVREGGGRGEVGDVFGCVLIEALLENVRN